LTQSKSRLLVVLGMHRSGTSAVTRGLQALGVDLGQRLMPAIEGNNDKGFFEDVDLNALNIDLLKLVGQDWHTLSPIRLQTFNSTNLDAYKRTAIDLLQTKMGHRPFAIKDPRIVRLFPFWRSVFSELAVDVSYVIATRHPMSVAQSLRQRDGFESEKSYYLWLQHVVPSILETRGAKRIVIDFDLLMEDPPSQLRRTAHALQLDFDAGSKAMREYVDEFLDPELRHTRFDLDALRADPAAPGIAIGAYETLVRIQRDDLDIDAPQVEEVFARIRTDLEAIAPAFSYMARTDQKISDLTREAQQLHTNLTDSREQLARLEQQINTFQDQLRATHAHLKKQTADLAAYQRQAMVFDEQIKSTQEELRNAYVHIEAQAADLAAYQRQAMVFDEQIKSTQEELRNAYVHIEAQAADLVAYRHQGSLSEQAQLEAESLARILRTENETFQRLLDELTRRRDAELQSPGLLSRQLLHALRNRLSRRTS
jgi:O-antigen biosynthesis protein